MQPPNNEIGRELKVDELKPRTVVVTCSETRPERMATMWVDMVEKEMVWFFLGAVDPRVYIGTYRKPDGTLRDGQGVRIHVYEYLGTV